MTRLDKFVVFLLAAAVLAMLVVQRLPVAYDPEAGRRPVPAPADRIASAAPAVPTPAERRVRRPLPGPSPGDPVFSVNVEPFRPGTLAVGTSFSVGSGLWLTARHVANRGCRQVLLVVDGAQIPAEIAFLHPDADLALLRTRARAAPALPLSAEPVTRGKAASPSAFRAPALAAPRTG